MWPSFIMILLGSKAAKVIQLIEYNKHQTCEKLLVLLNTVKILVLKEPEPIGTAWQLVPEAIDIALNVGESN